jgi:hypothetical protein
MIIDRICDLHGLVSDGSVIHAAAAVAALSYIARHKKTGQMLHPS